MDQRNLDFLLCKEDRNTCLRPSSVDSTQKSLKHAKRNKSWCQWDCFWPFPFGAHSSLKDTRHTTFKKFDFIQFYSLELNHLFCVSWLMAEWRNFDLNIFLRAFLGQQNIEPNLWGTIGITFHHLAQFQKVMQLCSDSTLIPKKPVLQLLNLFSRKQETFNPWEKSFDNRGWG